MDSKRTKMLASGWVRPVFHGLVAIFGTGVLAVAAVFATLSAAAPHPHDVMMLVSLANVAVLAGIWAATLAVLEPPSLSERERKFGVGILVAMTVAGPVLILGLTTLPT